MISSGEVGSKDHAARAALRVSLVSSWMAYPVADTHSLSVMRVSGKQQPPAGLLVLLHHSSVGPGRTSGPVA